MSDDLKNLYAAAGRIADYFDAKVPQDLFRGQRRTESKQGVPVLQPNPGFRRKDGTVRPPDLLIVDVDGRKVVKGCRTLEGFHRGISTFDRPNSELPSMSWFRLPAGTALPEALAITRESTFANRANHFTIAPKDDMALDLFLVCLNALARHIGSEEVAAAPLGKASSSPGKGIKS